VPTVDFSKEKLYFCFCDLYEGKFIFSDNGSLYVLDFEQASFLPISLMTYALIQARPVCTAIRDKLSLPQENLPGMRLACSYFVRSTRRIGTYYVTRIWLSFINQCWIQDFFCSELVNFLASRIKRIRPGSRDRRGRVVGRQNRLFVALQGSLMFKSQCCYVRHELSSSLATRSIDLVYTGASTARIMRV
jgi:hypothetical protein